MIEIEGIGLRELDLFGDFVEIIDGLAHSHPSPNENT
jgi:hypothetical protein